MTDKKLFFLTALLLCTARVALCQEVCSSASPLHVAVFNTQGTADAQNVQARMAEMAAILPQTADTQGLDVLCLNELRDAQSRSTVVQAFQSDANTTWNIYQPVAAPQPGCSHACISNSTYTYEDITLPINTWVEVCSVAPVNGQGSPTCADSTTEAGYEACMQNFCPFLNGLLHSVNNPQCAYCLQDTSLGNNIEQRVVYCAATYNEQNQGKCVYGHNGEAGATLISRYQLQNTEYHQFAPPANTAQFGLDNWGITYGKIQTPMGPVHLFCASHATNESGMSAGAAQHVNQDQLSDIVLYINLKANGEPAIYMSDTGSGPAVFNSQTGPANAEWLGNYSFLETHYKDALINNLDANSRPSPDPACTTDCDSDTAAYVDHIMTSGMAINEQGVSAKLCHMNGMLLFTPRTDGEIEYPLSTHFGVSSDISVMTNKSN